VSRYVEEHRKSFGVEPICRTLAIAPSSYYAARSRPPTARAIRDEALKAEITNVHAAGHPRVSTNPSADHSPYRRVLAEDRPVAAGIGVQQSARTFEAEHDGYSAIFLNWASSRCAVVGPKPRRRGIWDLGCLLCVGQFPQRQSGRCENRSCTPRPSARTTRTGSI
jgi:hypothetical protein